MEDEFDYDLVNDKLNAARSIAIVLADAEDSSHGGLPEGVASNTLDVIASLIEDAQRAIDEAFRTSPKPAKVS